MGRIKINTAQVVGATFYASNAKGIVNGVASDVLSVRYRTDGRILSRNGIASRLDRAYKMVSEIEREILAVYSTANRSAEMYERTEERIVNQGSLLVGRVGANQVCAHGTSTKNDACFMNVNTQVEKKQTDAAFDWKTSKLAWDVVGSFGAVGKVTSAVGKTVTDGVNAKTLLGAGSKFVTTVGDLAKEAFKPSDEINIKNVLVGKFAKGSAVEGLVDISSEGKIFSSSMNKQIGEYNFGNAVNLGDKIKVATKWAGFAVTGITNGIDNYNEFGTVKSKRFWEETALETIIDVGVGMGATAAVTALLGVSAPAVAVGAVAAGAVWLLDLGVRAATKKYGKKEKDFAELVTDTILDGKEIKVKMAKQLLGKVGNAIGNVQNSIATKWKLSFT